MFSGKNFNKTIIILIISAAIIGIILCLSGGKGKENVTSVMSEEEEKIKNIVESFDGVKDAVVLINPGYINDGNTVIAASSQKQEKVCGIAVMAVGAESPAVQKKIIDLLSSAYGIQSNRIYVCGKK